MAGGVAIQRGEDSWRSSNDIDFFHDTEVAVRLSSAADITLLCENLFDVERILDQPGFVRALVTKEQNALKLEWVRDTAFRFFPVIEDEDLAYRLHDVDLMVNKCLALANRHEVRDIIDLLELHESVMSLDQACFAACGKDPGFNPELLIDCMKRNSIVDPQQLAAESLHKKIDAVDLKKSWLALLHETEITSLSFPAADLGCIYLDSSGKVIKRVDFDKLPQAIRHFGTVGGSWPRIVE